MNWAVDQNWIIAFDYAVGKEKSTEIAFCLRLRFESAGAVLESALLTALERASIRADTRFR
jgi:hypothetical protein